MTEQNEGDDILALMGPIAESMASLSLDGRITLLSCLLAQEICNFPPSERSDELRRTMNDMPSILDATEEGTREALVSNARRGI